MIKHRQVINEKTGEVYHVDAQYFSECMTDEGYRFPYHKAGARLFEGVMFPSGMTDAEIGRMCILSKLMIGQTNMLGYRRGKNIMAYTAQEIGELIRVKRTQALRFVNRMCKFRVMQRINTNSGSQYYLNPAYFMASGKRLSLDLFLLFRDEITPILPAWVINDFLRQAKEKQVQQPRIISEAEWLVSHRTGAKCQ
jgi:hypothetical protein